MLPFCFAEIAEIDPHISTDQLLFDGSLPAIFSENRDPVRTYRNYYETYVERDLRSLIQIRDVSLFRTFLKRYYNQGLDPELYYFNFLKNLTYFRKIYPGRIHDGSILVYDGREETIVQDTRVMNFRKLYGKVEV